MKDPKYKLIEPTEEEKKAFMEKFNVFLQESGMYYEPVPAFSRDSLTDPWKVVCQVFLQKKVLTEEAIPSPFNEPIKEA